MLSSAASISIKDYKGESGKGAAEAPNSTEKIRSNGWGMCLERSQITQDDLLGRAICLSKSPFTGRQTFTISLRLIGHWPLVDLFFPIESCLKLISKVITLEQSMLEPLFRLDQDC